VLCLLIILVFVCLAHRHSRQQELLRLCFLIVHDV